MQQTRRTLGEFNSVLPADAIDIFPQCLGSPGFYFGVCATYRLNKLEPTDNELNFGEKNSNDPSIELPRSGIIYLLKIEKSKSQDSAVQVESENESILSFHVSDKISCAGALDVHWVNDIQHEVSQGLRSEEYLCHLVENSCIIIPFANGMVRSYSCIPEKESSDILKLKEIDSFAPILENEQSIPLALSIDTLVQHNNSRTFSLATCYSNSSIQVHNVFRISDKHVDSIRLERKLRFYCANAHNGLEAWTVALDPCNYNVSYSGGDDGDWAVWDHRAPWKYPESIAQEDARRDSLQVEMQSLHLNHTLRNHVSHATATAMGRVRDAHNSVGVTSLVRDKQREHILYSGGYDDMLRVWDVRMIQNRFLKGSNKCLFELNMGGGVWRIKQHPEKKNIFLIACMYNGFKAIEIDGNMERGQWGGRIISEYKRQTSIGYGACWVGNSDIAASASFYDHSVHLWESGINEHTLL